MLHSILHFIAALSTILLLLWVPLYSYSILPYYGICFTFGPCGITVRRNCPRTHGFRMIRETWQKIPLLMIV